MATVVVPGLITRETSDYLQEAASSVTNDQWLRLGSGVDKMTPFLVDHNGLPLGYANQYLRKRAAGRLEVFSFRRLASNSVVAFAHDLAYFFNTFSEPTPELLLLNARDGNLMQAYVTHLESSAANLMPSTISRRKLVAGEFLSYLGEIVGDHTQPINEQHRQLRKTLIGDSERPISYFATANVPTSRRRSPTLIYVLPPDQLRNFLASFPDPIHRQIAKLIYATGMRRSEVVRITVEQVMNLRPIFPGGPAVLPIVGKGNKARTVEIEPMALSLMKGALISKERLIRLRSSRLLKSRGPGDVPLFINQFGTPMSGEAVTDAFQRTSDRCGIKRTPHELRHEFATNYLLCAYRQMAHRLSRDKLEAWLVRLMVDKVSMVVLRLSRILGHSDSDTTKRIYLSSLMNSDPGIREAWCQHLDTLELTAL